MIVNIAKLHKNFSRLRTQLTSDVQRKSCHRASRHHGPAPIQKRPTHRLPGKSLLSWSQWPVKSLEKAEEGRKKIRRR